MPAAGRLTIRIELSGKGIVYLIIKFIWLPISQKVTVGGVQQKRYKKNKHVSNIFLIKKSTHKILAYLEVSEC